MKSIFASSARVFLAIGIVALLVQGAFGHTYLSSVVLGGTALAPGDCVRPHPPSGPDSPISLVSSANMTCGFLPYSAQAANRACPIAAGSQIGVQWHHSNTTATDDILDPSHKGPVIFYLAKSSNGAGDVWFKIWEDGYDSTNAQWATDRLIAAHGLITVTIPADIEPGSYLLRGEVLALHNAYELDGVQPYVGCVELTISGSGTNNPSATGVAFPGEYVDTDPSLLINIYTTFPLPYVIPGPPLYEGSSSSSTPTTAPTTAPTSAPTTAPSTPTSAPTSAPTTAPTTAPTSAPTSAPSSGSLTVQLNPGSSAWWVGVIVSGGSQATTKVEIMDSGSVTSWTALTNMQYAYVFSASVQLTLPISVRLTSSTGVQVALTDVFTSWSTTPINTGKNYGTSTSTPAPTAAPTHAATSAPTAAPTHAATSAPTASPTHAATAAPTAAPTHAATPAPTTSSNPVTVTLHPSANSWWFAVQLGGVSADSVASVELKDSGAVSSYALMTYNTWGYSLSAQGAPFATPITIRITNEAGQSVTATVTSIIPNAVVEASGSL